MRISSERPAGRQLNLVAAAEAVEAIALTQRRSRRWIRRRSLTFESDSKRAAPTQLLVSHRIASPRIGEESCHQEEPRQKLLATQLSDATTRILRPERVQDAAHKSLKVPLLCVSLCEETASNLELTNCIKIRVLENRRLTIGK